ncbi:YcaO-like family protein [Streptomyces sp. NPDC050147]|uniref:YcaO-like family protein n=1 Tax=Streptomyces sp. NPDC050147 TaxID=3155513 RepID=UPI00344372C7
MPSLHERPGVREHPSRGDRTRPVRGDRARRPVRPHRRGSGRAGGRVDAEHPYCAALLERFAERGCWWELRHVPNRYGVPVMCCHLWREDQSAAVVAGSGAHPDPGIALSRAITEAAQTRPTLISGSREDNQPLVYRPGPHRAPASSAGNLTPWPEIASRYGAPADTDTELAHDLATAVTTATGRASLVVDLTWGPYECAEFAVVKVCAPALRYTARHTMPRPKQVA